MTEKSLRRTLVLPIAAAGIFVVGGCGGHSGGVPSNAIAVVGEQTVTKPQLDDLLNQTRASSRKSGRPFPKPRTPQYRQIRAQLVQFLVRRAQLAAEAKARGLEVSDEQIEQRRKVVVERYFRGDDGLYAERLEKNGLTEQQARADIEATLIQEALLEDVGKDVKLSDAELSRYYQKNKRKYARSFDQVKEVVRAELLQAKRNEAKAKYLARLARKDNVDYQVGFGPRIARQGEGRRS